MKKLKILYEDKDLLVVRKDDKVLTVSDGKSYNTLYSEVYDYLHKKNQKVSVLAFSAGTPGGGIYGDAENFGSRHKPMIRL